MLIQNLIDEIEGISILIGEKLNKEYFEALKQLNAKNLEELKNSYAQEFKTLTGKDII